MEPVFYTRPRVKTLVRIPSILGTVASHDFAPVLGGVSPRAEEKLDNRKQRRPRGLFRGKFGLLANRFGARTGPRSH